MLTTRSRKAKLERVDDEALKARLAAAEATVREIDALPPAKVRGREKDVLGRYETALAMIDLGRAELATREHEHVAANAPARRALRDEEDARRAKHKALAPVIGALEFVRRRAHPELRGHTLVADRLAEAEAEELVALVSKARRVAYDENAPSLNPGEVVRYEALVGAAADDPELFAKWRREQDAREKVRALGQQRRVASLPQRPRLAEPGSIELPRFVHSWLATDENRDGRFTVMDLGVLAALLFAFENRDASVVAGARFEEVDDEPVLVIPGGVGSEMRFARALGGSSLSDPDGSGHVRLRPALRNLVANKWLVTEVTTAEIRVRLGEHAKRLRGGAA